MLLRLNLKQFQKEREIFMDKNLTEIEKIKKVALI